MTEIQSLARGLKILDMVAQSKDGVGINAIARQLDIDKSSASRLVKTLSAYHFLELEANSRRYVFGRRMREISWLMLNEVPIRDKARPYLDHLVTQTGECAHTAVYSEGQALMIDDVQSRSSTLIVVGQVGRRIGLHCTAVGKALLAFMDVPIPSTLQRYTPRTITDFDALDAHLVQVREQGYALDDEEHEPGVRCLAAPVYNADGRVIATIGISGPTLRVTPDRIEALAQHVVRAACGLSEDLGYKQQPIQPTHERRQP